MEVMIHQHFYYPGIINDVQKEVTNCNTCQCTKQPNKKYGKLPDKEAEKIPWNKLCVDLIGPYVIRRKVQQENLHLKAITIIYPLTGWFEIMKYNDKRAISIEDLNENTWPYRYPIPTGIKYDQG